MTRHVLVGHFGESTGATLPAQTNETTTAIDLLDSRRKLRHGIGRAITDLNRMGVFPSEIGLDLMVVAALVHAADTRIARATESQDSWTREFRIVVPVSDPKKWAGATSVLVRMLNFLTGDYWNFEFQPRPNEFTTVVPSPGLAHARPSFDSLSLYSGGLDSLIGAIDLLESGKEPLLISHAGESAASDAQTACFDRLKAYYSSRSFDRLRVWMNFRNGTVEGVRSEKTTRGRSFLFLSLGVFAGTGFKKRFLLNVPENGLIALNIPLDILRLGANSTRTTHPFYLARWNEMLAILEIKGGVENRYWSQTKGEMVANCANSTLLRQIVSSSLSCSAPTKGRWQGHGIKHCGYCVPCLIRRAAFKSAKGRGWDDPTDYIVDDLRAHALDTRRAEGQQVRSFQTAIERLLARPGLEKLLIHKSGPLTDNATQLAALADVYRRGMMEVHKLLRGVRSSPSP